jgi:hypothetical protein
VASKAENQPYPSLEEQAFLQKLCIQTPIVRNETIRIHQMTIEHLLTSGTPPVYIKTRHDPLIPTENQPRPQKKTREKKKITSLETVADRSVTTERKPLTKHNPKEGAHKRDDLFITDKEHPKKRRKKKKKIPTDERTNKKDDQYCCKTRSRTTITRVGRNCSKFHNVDIFFPHSEIDRGQTIEEPALR